MGATPAELPRHELIQGQVAPWPDAIAHSILGVQKESLPGTWAPYALHHHPAGHRMLPQRAPSAATDRAGDASILAPSMLIRNSPNGTDFWEFWSRLRQIMCVAPHGGRRMRAAQVWRSAVTVLWRFDVVDLGVSRSQDRQVGKARPRVRPVPVARAGGYESHVPGFESVMLLVSGNEPTSRRGDQDLICGVLVRPVHGPLVERHRRNSQ